MPMGDRRVTKRTYPTWIFKVIVPTMSAIVVIGMLEVGLRITAHFGGNSNRANALPLWEAVPDRRPFTLRKNFAYEFRTPEFDMRIKTNDFGLRENQPIAHLLDHEFRILSMGDSQTFGYGVNYGERYSDLLNGILGARAVAFTSGYADGFSPVDYAGYLQSLYSYLLPDIVIVGFFPENDVVNDVLTRRIERDGNGDIVGTKLNGFRVVDGFLTADSGPSTSFMRSVVRAKNWMWDTFAVYRLAEETRNVVRYWLHPDLQNTQLPLFFFGFPSNQGEIDITLRALDQMDRFLKAREKTLLVVLIPSNFQIDQRYEASVTRRPGYRVSSEWITTARQIREPQTSFGRWLQEKHIRYIDPTEKFVSAELRGVHLYFDYDGHLNRAGHAFVAKLVSDYLLQHRLVPCVFLTPQAALGVGCQG